VSLEFRAAPGTREKAALVGHAFDANLVNSRYLGFAKCHVENLSRPLDPKPIVILAGSSPERP
jgi:hypothetical protein